MRNYFILVLLFLIFKEVYSQIDQIPGIVIQNDIDFMDDSKSMVPFYDDYIFIYSYENGQLWLTNGEKPETKMILDYQKEGNTSHIEVIEKIAFVFIHSFRDSNLTIYQIENKNAILKLKSKISGSLRDFKRINDRIHFTSLYLGFPSQFQYYNYDISNNSVNKILNTTEALLISPINWHQQLYYIGSLKGHRGTWLARYNENSDTILGIAMLDSTYTFSQSKLVIQDSEFFYMFAGFVQLPPGNEYHSYLIRSDGTTNGTFKLKEIIGPEINQESEAYLWQGKLYFSGYDPYDSIGTELYVSDGTNNGTHLLNDLQSGKESFYPGNFVPYKNKLVFNSSLNAGFFTMRITDGTSIGTKKFALDFVYNLGPITVLEDTLVFCGSTDFLTSIGNEIFFYTDYLNFRYFDISPGNGNNGHTRLYQTILTPNKIFFVLNDATKFIHAYVYNRNELTNGIKNKPDIQNLLLFPNPVQNELYFKQEIDLKEITKISLITEEGQEIQVDDWSSNKINLKNISPGFYKILIYKKDFLEYSGSISKFK